MDKPLTIQEGPNKPNFRDENGELNLVRCYVCDPKSGRENYAMSVSAGMCCWCGWHEATPPIATEHKTHQGGSL